MVSEINSLNSESEIASLFFNCEYFYLENSFIFSFFHFFLDKFKLINIHKSQQYNNNKF